MIKFKHNGYPVTGLPRHQINVTKSDSGMALTNSIEAAGGLYVAYGGDVHIKTLTGSATFYNMPSGSVVPATGITHVMSTTTTASGFVALI